MWEAIIKNNYVPPSYQSWKDRDISALAKLVAELNQRDCTWMIEGEVQDGALSIISCSAA